MRKTNTKEYSRFRFESMAGIAVVSAHVRKRNENSEEKQACDLNKEEIHN